MLFIPNDFGKAEAFFHLTKSSFFTQSLVLTS